MTDERKKAQNRAYYWRHRARRLAYMRTYYAANTDVVKARVAAWVDTHRERRNAIAAKHQRANRARYAVHDATRRARKRGDGTTHTLAEWQEVVALHGGCCAYCGATAVLVRDHIIPLARGGSNAIDNIAPACRSCNARKAAMPLVIFLARQAA